MPINDCAQYVNVTCLSYVCSTVSSVEHVYTVQPTRYKTNVVLYGGAGGVQPTSVVCIREINADRYYRI
jgi:hypothetical protein